MDPLYELLVPHQDQTPASVHSKPTTSASNAQATTYLNRLSTLSLSDLTSTEPASLLYSSQSHVRNLQALSKRSHKAIIGSSSHLQKLQDLLPAFSEKAGQLKDELPGLEDAASGFAKKYDRSADNEVLDRRARHAAIEKCGQSFGRTRASDLAFFDGFRCAGCQHCFGFQLNNIVCFRSGFARSHQTSYWSLPELRAHCWYLEAGGSGDQ